MYRLWFRRVVLLLLIALSLTVGPAEAQTSTVRVIASETHVRLEADPNSLAIAKVEAGTLLDVVGERGPWFTVSLSSSSPGQRRVGYVSASDVEPFAAPTLQSGATGAPVYGDRQPRTPSAASQSVADAGDGWQQDYAAAQRRVSAGKKKFFWGWALVGTGIVLSTVSSDAALDCDDFSCLESGGNGLATVGSLTALGGVVLTTWGGFQWVFAHGDVSDLQAERRARQRSAELIRLRIGAGTDLALNIGPTTHATMRFRW